MAQADTELDKVVQAFRNHPQWKSIENLIRQREMICLTELRDERDLYTICKRNGELYAYAWILGKIPNYIAEEVIETQERTK